MLASRIALSTLLTVAGFAASAASTDWVTPSKTYKGASVNDALSAAAQGGFTFLLSKGKQMLVASPVPTKIGLHPLNESDINAILSSYDESWTKSVGIGQFGGDTITFHYDQPQAARMAGVRSSNAINDSYKSAEDGIRVDLNHGENVSLEASRAKVANDLAPKVTEEHLQTHLVDRAGLETRLQALMKDGVTVKTVEFRTFLKGGAEKSLGYLQYFFIAGTATNALGAGLYAANGFTTASDKWLANQCQKVAVGYLKDQVVCDSPNKLYSAMTAWLDSASYWSYTPSPDQFNP